MLTPEELAERYEYDTALLADHYEGVFRPDEVGRAVSAAREHLERQVSVNDYLPLLVTRMAKDLLLARAQAEGRIAKALPEILYVSEHNSARSHMAAALTLNLAAGRVNVRCAGKHPRGGLEPDVVAVLAERGIALRNPYPLPFTTSLIGAADVVVTMGCPEFFDYAGKQWVDWHVEPVAGRGRDAIRAAADQLEARIAELLRENVLAAA